MINDAAAMTPLAGQLSETLHAGLLPRQYADWGKRLLQRLQQPVQVVVIGLPGSGKSALIDMLLGQPVLGQCPSAGMTEVRFGTSCRAEIETADGAIRHHEGRLSDPSTLTDPGLAALRLRQELPDPRLQGMSLTEITLFGAPSRQSAIMTQAVSYADILLFCSTEFSAPEQALWAGVPDERKDHSFLVLTMADRRIMRGTLEETITALEPLAAQEFLGLYPLAAVQGLTAQVGGGADQAGLDRQLWHSSGGKRLYDDLVHQIDQGRTSDLDQAEMLLRQFGPPDRRKAAPQPPRAAAEVATRPTAATAAASPMQTQINEQDLLAEACAMIREQAERMLAGCEGAEPPDLACVFDGALNSLRQVLHSLEPHAAQSPRLRALKDAAQDGEEVLMLCQLEQNEEAAIDAVTVLMQLRREMSPPA
ncbi:hypothetical protein [Phaeobacter sp. HF9A]|uniref:hypothetical protein n=1 Tax=Phaeobacter sp. HF9A TaxID=2721561 RepID=UPI001431197E|nr:hypothetical protein [Phaeobacter sp. HF9A]NIZ14743.1 hypothetical protein [Phaeobacter sp. HF9A]